MKKMGTTIWGTTIISIVLILVAASCSLYFFINRKNIRDLKADIGFMYDEVLSMKEQWESQGGDIKEDIGQIKTLINNIGSNDDDSQEIEATNRLLNKALDELEELRDIGSYNHEKILFLEKELIKQTSGAYANYNFYYYDEGNYSVRFSKDYLYEITEPQEGTSPYGVGGALTIFFDKANNESITLFPWHSRGVSTTMKNIPVKYMYTDEGEVIEYVEYETDGIDYMDFGFEDYFLKISCHFNKDNTPLGRKKVIDIVKTIMFYKFHFEKYD